MKTRRARLYPLAVVGFGAACVYAGYLGDLPLRGARPLLALAAVLVGFAALLWLGPG